MQNENLLQKIVNLLNTSSQTFMLIALVSLFVLPIVMAKNIEPVVKSAYKPSVTSLVTDTQIEDTVAKQEDSNVLGVSTSRTLKDFVTENTKSLEFFDNHSSTVTDSNYTLTVTTSKRFSKVNVFTVKNSGTSTVSYEFDALVNGDLKVKSNQDKFVYIDSVEYKLGVGALPTTILVSPGQEVVFSLMSNKTSPSNITLTLSTSE